MLWLFIDKKLYKGVYLEGINYINQGGHKRWSTPIVGNQWPHCLMGVGWYTVDITEHVQCVMRMSICFISGFWPLLFSKLRGGTIPTSYVRRISLSYYNPNTNPSPNPNPNPNPNVFPISSYLYMYVFPIPVPVTWFRLIIVPFIFLPV